MTNIAEPSIRANFGRSPRYTPSIRANFGRVEFFKYVIATIRRTAIAFRENRTFKVPSRYLALALFIAAPAVAQDGICSNVTWLKREQPAGMNCVGGSQDGNPCAWSYDCPGGSCGEVGSSAEADDNMENVRDACTADVGDWPWAGMLDSADDDAVRLKIGNAPKSADRLDAFSASLHHQVWSIDDPSLFTTGSENWLYGDRGFFEFDIDVGDEQDVTAVAAVYEAHKLGVGDMNRLSGGEYFSWNEGGGDVDYMSGVEASVLMQAGDYVRARSLYGHLSVSSSATITDAAMLWLDTNFSSGTVTNYHGIHFEDMPINGTVSNRYAIKIPALSGSASTEDWALHSEATQRSYIKGSVFFGNLAHSSSDTSRFVEIGEWYSTPEYEKTGWHFDHRFDGNSSGAGSSGIGLNLITGTVQGRTYDLEDGHVGIQLQVNSGSTGSAGGEIHGVKSNVGAQGQRDTITALYGEASAYSTTTTLQGLRIRGPHIQSGTTTNRYAIHIDPILLGSATGNDFAIYSESAMPSFFTGPVIVDDVLQLTPKTDAPTCGSAEEGHIYADDSGALCYCANSIWRIAAAGGGTCM